MWGIIPAAGAGSRIQPLAFSKELLPVGSRVVDGIERPRAVSEYLIERMLRAGVDKICFVIAPGKRDILEYFDAVRCDAEERVLEIIVKQPDRGCSDVWGAVRLPGLALHALHALWLRRNRQDEYLGTLINAHLAEGGEVFGAHLGESYVDVGTVHGYRQALTLLGSGRREPRERTGATLPQ